jgi:hypothetical protein
VNAPLKRVVAGVRVRRCGSQFRLRSTRAIWARSHKAGQRQTDLGPGSVAARTVALSLPQKATGQHLLLEVTNFLKIVCFVTIHLPQSARKAETRGELSARAVHLATGGRDMCVT